MGELREAIGDQGGTIIYSIFNQGNQVRGAAFCVLFLINDSVMYVSLWFLDSAKFLLKLFVFLPNLKVR